MRFRKKTRNWAAVGRRLLGKTFSSQPPATAMHESAPIPEDGSDPENKAMMSPHDEEPIVTGDPTQRLLTALGRFQRQVSRAENAAPHDEWCEACMAQVVTGLEIAIEEEWENVREALIDTARVLQTYEEYGCPEKALPFLKDAYEILCLMVGDLLVDNFHSGVVKKWRERYRKAVEDIEAAGMKLFVDEMEDEQEEEPESATAPQQSASYEPAPSPDNDGMERDAPRFAQDAANIDDTDEADVAVAHTANEDADYSPFAAPEEKEVGQEDEAEARDFSGNDFFAAGDRDEEFLHAEDSSTAQAGSVRELDDEGDTDSAHENMQDSWNSDVTESQTPERAMNLQAEERNTSESSTAYYQDSVDFVPEDSGVELKTDNRQTDFFETVGVDDPTWELPAEDQQDATDSGHATKSVDTTELEDSEAAVNNAAEAEADAAVANEDLTAGIEAGDSKVHDDEEPTRPAQEDTDDDVMAQSDRDAHDVYTMESPDQELAAATLGEYTRSQAQVGESPENMQDDQNNVFDTETEDHESATATIEGPLEKSDDAADGAAATSAELNTSPAPDSPEALWKNIQAAFSQGNVSDAKVVALQLAAQMAHLEVKKAEEHVQELEARVEQDQEAIDTARSALETARKEAQDAEWILGERKAELTRQQESRLSLDEELLEVQGSIEDLDRQIAELQQRREAEEQRRGEVQEKIDAVFSLEAEIEEKMQSLQDTELNNKSMFELAEQELAELEEKRREHAEALETAQNKLLEQMFSEESILKTIQSFSGGDAGNAPDDNSGNAHTS